MATVHLVIMADNQHSALQVRGPVSHHHVYWEDASTLIFVGQSASVGNIVSIMLAALEFPEYSALQVVIKIILQKSNNFISFTDDLMCMTEMGVAC